MCCTSAPVRPFAAAKSTTETKADLAASSSSATAHVNYCNPSRWWTTCQEEACDQRVAALRDKPCAQLGAQGIEALTSRPDLLIDGCVGAGAGTAGADGCGLYAHAALLKADQRLYDCGRGRSNDTDFHDGRSSCSPSASFSSCYPVRSAGQSAGALPAGFIPPTAAVAAAAAAAAAAWTTSTPGGPRIERSVPQRSGEEYGSCDDVTVFDGNEHDEEICSLLRPGGSPCLPLEESWAAAVAARTATTPITMTTAAAAGFAAAAASSAIDNSLVDTDGWWPGSLSGSGCSSRSSSTTPQERLNAPGNDGGLDKNGGEQLQPPPLPAGRRRRPVPPPPPPLSHHRACQSGYTDSAPARSMAAAAGNEVSVRDLGFVFLRTPNEVPRQLVLGGTLSAPPGATAAATATGRQAAVGVSAKARELAIVKPLMERCEAPTWEPSGSLDEVEVAQAQGCEHSCGHGGVASPAAAAAAAAVARSRLVQSFAAVCAPHWTLPAVAAAATATAPPPPSACRDLGLEPSLATASVRSEVIAGEPSVSFFDRPLSDGLAALLHELAAGCGGGAAADGTESGAQSTPVRARCVTPSVEQARQQQQKQKQKQQSGGAVAIASGRSRGFGRSLLACFTGF